MPRQVGAQFVVAAAKTLHERVPGRERPFGERIVSSRIGRSRAVSRP